MLTNFLFTKKFNLFFWFFLLTTPVDASEQYYSIDFFDSSVYDFIKNENNIFLITKDDVNSKVPYGQEDFYKEFFSSLYQDGNFIIYMNEEFLNEKCINVFQFYDLKSCENMKFQKFLNNFIKENKTEFYEYENNFNYFVFYHELSHLLIYKKWGNKYNEDIEYLADLMSLDLIWMFHGVDYRENLYTIRKNQFYFKSRSDSKYFMKYLDYDINKSIKDLNVENWLQSVLVFSEKTFLSENERQQLKENLIEMNKKISRSIHNYTLDKNVSNIQEYFDFINRKTSTDSSFFKNL